MIEIIDHTKCGIDHAAELTIPQWLCRKCHPELNLTAEQWSEEIKKCSITPISAHTEVPSDSDKRTSDLPIGSESMT